MIEEVFPYISKGKTGKGRVKVEFHFGMLNVLYLLFVLPYLTPSLIIDKIRPLHNLTMYFSMAGMMVAYLKKPFSIKWYILPFCMMYSVFILSTFGARGLVFEAVKHSIRLILICLFLGTVIGDKKKEYVLLSTVANLVLVYFVLNMMVVTVYRNGIPGMTGSDGIPMFLYGNVNTTIKFIIPGMLCSYILDIKNHKISIRSMILVFGNVYTFIISYHATTALVGALFLFICFFYRDKLKNHSKKLYLAAIITVIIMEFIIVISTNSDIIERIASFFGKDPTLSNRTFLWKNIMRSIRTGPVYGYGMQGELFLMLKIGNPNGCHNYYLDLVFQRGIMGPILLLAIVVIPFLYLKKKTDIGFMFLGCSMTYLIMFMFEPFFGTEYFFIPIFYAMILVLDKTERYGRLRPKVS